MMHAGHLRIVLVNHGAIQYDLVLDFGNCFPDGTFNAFQTLDYGVLNRSAEKGGLPMDRLLVAPGKHSVISLPTITMLSYSSLNAAASAGDLDAVRRFLADGVDVDFIANGRFNSTALQEAARAGHLAVVRMLLQVGADPNHVDNDFFTPANSAARAGNWEVVKFLVWEGADFYVADGRGRSAADYLSRCRSKRVQSEVLAVVNACAGEASNAKLSAESDADGHAK